MAPHLRVYRKHTPDSGDFFFKLGMDLGKVRRRTEDGYDQNTLCESPKELIKYILKMTEKSFLKSFIILPMRGKLLSGLLNLDVMFLAPP